MLSNVPKSIFNSLSKAQRKQFQDRYLAFLRNRDGIPNSEAGTLSNRESVFAHIERRPVRRPGPAVEQGVFDHNAVENDYADAGLSKTELWAVCAAKMSRAEQYSVQYLADHGKTLGGALDDPRTFIELEEQYHTRILADALRALGVKARFRRPAWRTRVALHAILALPHWLSDLTVLCGELIGVASFKLLLDSARELFASEPSTLHRIEYLLNQIIIDELGHVLYLRSVLGPVRLGLARLILPIVAQAIVSDTPEAVQLFGRKRLLDEINKADIMAIAGDWAESLTPQEAILKEPPASIPPS